MFIIGKISYDWL
jgi:hypothetical protein